MAAKNIDAWVMACVPAAVQRSNYQADIVGMATFGVVSGTEQRDVSQVLDLLALAETPFINRIGWGPESGGTIIEWISEDLGPGIIENISAIASGAAGSLLLNSIDGVTGSDLVRQLHAGTILYVFNSEDAAHGLAVITSQPAIATTACSILVSYLNLGYVGLTGLTTIDADTQFFVLGNVQNEGSLPGRAWPRDRVILTNIFTILRQDVAITGSMANTDMYLIGREDKHQVMMRMKEMQRERERAALYSVYSAKTSVAAGLMNGALGFLMGVTGTHLDITTRALTKTALNNVVTAVWENGGRNLTAFGDIKQIAKITRWDENRIRTSVNDRLGGGMIDHYLCECGIEIELVPMAKVPNNILFILDTSRIQLRAKRGRKAIMEKLGKMGDFDDWQLISEFSMEMKGFNLGQHGMFSVLAP